MRPIWKPFKSSNGFLPIFILVIVAIAGVYFLNGNAQDLLSKVGIKIGNNPIGSDLKWVRQQFGNSWDVEYPANWSVNEKGLIEGGLQFAGIIDGRQYQATLAYPIDALGVSVNLDSWLGSEISSLTLVEKSKIRTEDISIVGIKAKKVFGLPGSEDKLFILKNGDKNPRTLDFKQVGGAFDQAKLDQVFNEFVSRIH